MHGTTFFKDYSSTEEANTSTPTPIIKVDGQDVPTVVLLRNKRRESSLRLKKKTCDRPKNYFGCPNRECHPPCHKRSEGLLQELGTHLHVKLVEDSVSVLYLGRLCAELRCSYSWEPRGHPTLTKSKKPTKCCPDNFVLLATVTKQNYSICQARPPPRNTLCQARKLKKPW